MKMTAKLLKKILISLHLRIKKLESENGRFLAPLVSFKWRAPNKNDVGDY